MEFKPLHLDAHDFTDVPTATQLANLLNDTNRFLSKVGGVLLATETNKITDQPVALLMNATIQLKAAADAFEAAASGQSGLVHAMPAPPAGMGPRRA